MNLDFDTAAILTRLILDEPRPVFLAKSCERCPGEASHDIMTLDGQWHFLCFTCIIWARNDLKAGYPIKVVHRCNPTSS